MSRTVMFIQRLFGAFLIASIITEQLGWRPPAVAGPGAPLMAAIQEAGYFFVVIRLVYVVAGAGLMTDRFAPLSAIVLFPISLNILLFHSVLHPGGIPPASAFFLLSCLVLYANRAAYRPLLEPRILRTQRGGT